MRILLFTALLALTALLLIACQDIATPVSLSKAPAAAPTPPATNNAHEDDGAPRIGLADAKKAFDDKTAVFIDTRGEDIYRQKHVKGAINITLQDDASKYDTIPKGKKIIVYCS